MATGDMEATIRFWRDLLGMRLVARLGNPGYRQYFFEISDKDLLVFFEWPGVQPIQEKEHGRPQAGMFVFDHVSLGVVSEDGLWLLKDKLSAADIWVSEVIDHGFIHSIYTFDPNGIAVEFSWSVPERDVRVKPVMADASPPSVASESVDPIPGYWPEATHPTPREERRFYPGAGSELFHGRKK